MFLVFFVFIASQNVSSLVKTLIPTQNELNFEIIFFFHVNIKKIHFTHALRFQHN